MVELEQLSEHRFYKLKPIWRKQCDCGGLLWLHMTHGSLNLRCRHVGCFKEYEIVRECTYCKTQYDFDDVTCDDCEKIVVDVTTCIVTIEECDKAIKKINRAFKQNLVKEDEWKHVRGLNEEEKKRCESQLEKLKEGLNYSQFTN